MFIDGFIGTKKEVMGHWVVAKPDMGWGRTRRKGLFKQMIDVWKGVAIAVYFYEDFPEKTKRLEEIQ